jgi:tetrahydromethanopterin S-methyltransferase subunit E
LDDDLVAALIGAGVDEFVHAGSDVIDQMGRTLDALGVDTPVDVEGEWA